jgi:hypothetical protein
MRSDAKYESLKPSWQQVGERFEQFMESAALAHNGSLGQRRVREESFNELMNALVTVALQLEALAQGDKMLVQGAGFEVKGVKKLNTKISYVINNLRVENSADNELTIRWEPVDGSMPYLFQYRLEGTEDWKSVSLNRVRYVLSNLKSRLVYEFRVGITPMGATEPIFTNIVRGAAYGIEN